MRIKTIIILLMLMLTSVFFAGCVGNDEPVIEEIVSAINETPEEDEEIPEEIEETPTEETEVAEDMPAVDPQTHTIWMEYYLIRPSTFDINKGDTVTWINNQNPKKMFTLVSENGLWENTNLVYGRTLKYTFNNSGTYNFSVIGQPKMSGSIIVK